MFGTIFQDEDHTWPTYHAALKTGYRPLSRSNSHLAHAEYLSRVRQLYASNVRGLGFVFEKTAKQKISGIFVSYRLQGLPRTFRDRRSLRRELVAEAEQTFLFSLRAASLVRSLVRLLTVVAYRINV